VRVLYVNHTGTVGGAERSLLELLAGLPNHITAALACPEGDLASAARRLSVPVTPIPGTALSFRVDPVATPLGLANLGRAAIAVWRTTRRFNADVVHANSVRAGLITAPLGVLPRLAVVVHVRDCLPTGAAGAATRRVIDAAASLIIANSSYTAASFAPDGSHARLRAIHNCVDLTAFDPACIDREAARLRLGLDSKTVALGVIGQITPWKGQDDAVRMLAALRRRTANTRLLIIGTTKFAHGSETFDNLAFKDSLHALVRDLNLEGAVCFLGERTDVPEILRALDLVLVPSWEEPFGRSVIEAMAIGAPVIVTSIGGPAEIVTDGVDGRLLPPRQPDLWAEAAAELLEDPGRLKAIAAAGRRTAVARFAREVHLRAVLAAYDDALTGRLDERRIAARQVTRS
jgi:L-malate glycosyltransferase